MKNLHNLPWAAVSAILLLTTSATLRASGPPSAPPFDEAVVLTGWIHVEDHDFDDAVVKVEVNGEEHSMHVTKAGRFTISLPVDIDAVLRFEHPDHLTKEVVVNTRHARDGEAGHHVRHLKFGVVLELERHMAGFSYAGPVGSIAFDEIGGCFAVDKERKLITGKRNKPMVF